MFVVDHSGPDVGHHEHKVHGNAALEALARSSLSKYSPDSTIDTITGSGASDRGCSLSNTLDPPSSSRSDSLTAENSEQHPILEPVRSRSLKLGFLSCFGYGASSQLIVDSDKSVSACEVGIRPSFYWLDSPVSEEARLSAEASARWIKSDCQDDALVIENFSGLPHLTFVGVFDGHGPYGRLAAKFSSTYLPKHLAAMASAFRTRSERKRMAAIKEACIRTDSDMQDMSIAGFDCSLSGTTACFALIDGTKVYVANVGDSRCVVARRELDGTLSAVPLTVDAKPQLPEEMRRINANGGVVRQLVDETGKAVGAHRVFRRGDNILPGLAMSRSLGDGYAHAVGVSPEPLITTYMLTSRDQFLLLGTDGLWDVMDSSAVADFVDRYRCRRDEGITSAEALTLEAQERWKEQHDEALVDDISVAILHLTPLPPPERSVSIPRPLARAASCNDEANAIAHSWQEAGGSFADTNPSHHSPRRFFEHLWSDEETEGAAGGTSGGLGPRSTAPSSAIQSPIRFTSSHGSVPESPMNEHQPRLRVVTPSRTSSGISIPAPPPSSAYNTTGGQPPAFFAGRSAPSAPIAMGMRASRAVSMPANMNNDGSLLRPIRKAYPSASFGSRTLRSASSWDPNSSFNSDVGLVPGEGDTPRSSDSGSHRRGDRKCRRGEGGLFEGKVRKGVPRSLSAGFLGGLVSGGSRRVSVESDRSVSVGLPSRMGSFEELTLGPVSEAGDGERPLEYHI